MDPAEAFEKAMLSRHQDISEATSYGNSDIQLFYSNAAVLITGGSGFLGKQLIEKLFRSCKIRKLFLLIRSKRGKNGKDRIADILKDPVFELLRQCQPDFQDRIFIVEGDLVLSKLGLSEETWNTVTEEVTSIFHGAATLKFDEPLQTAAFINVRGTREMLQLGRACKQLRSFVYISTAYSHVTYNMLGKVVMEEFYPVPIPPDVLVQLAETIEAERLDKIAPGLMDGWPNTYCFTKALAEELVRTNGFDLPICIIRPAIIIGAYEEPTPGWIDSGSLYGACGLMLGYITGIVHVNFSKPKGKMDFVPVDLVNNAVIAACCETGKRWDEGRRDIKIYTVTSGRTSLTPETCARILHTSKTKIASPKALWFIYVFVVDNIVLYNVLSFLCHEVPAIFVDGVRRHVMGKPPKLTPVYKKLRKMTAVLKYFTVYTWQFSDKNLVDLYRRMSKNDKTIFNFDMTTVSNKNIMVTWALGIRKFVLKDGLKNTNIGVKKQNVFQTFSYIVLFTYVFIVWIFSKFLLFIVASII